MPWSVARGARVARSLGLSGCRITIQTTPELHRASLDAARAVRRGARRAARAWLPRWSPQD
eukprot:6317627-Pyramimonas_sp.AAC.1